MTRKKSLIYLGGNIAAVGAAIGWGVPAWALIALSVLAIPAAVLFIVGPGRTGAR